MILLLSGTSDARPIVAQLLQSGHRVLVSQATEVHLKLDSYPNLETRAGPLDDASLEALVETRAIRAIIDATHPYATSIRATARRVAMLKKIPYRSFVRPPALDPAVSGMEIARDHAVAALMAFAHGRPVLLTTGTKHLTPYVEQSQRTGLRLVVRVLDHPGSQEACRKAGIAEEDVLAGRGPFSVEENRRHIRAFGIGVLVTKDSGQAGGTPEKLQAAQAEGCRVVVVGRPAQDEEHSFSDVDAMLASLAEVLVRSGCHG
jgi:precorrin-6A/cobalt-precorrin-6A reductase